MAGRLSGKVAIVTGAGSSGPGVGNGKATAVLFAREGARVLCVDQAPGRAEETVAMIRDEGGEATAVAADVSRRADCAAMAAAAVERYGRLDVLHNNVGVGAPGTAETVKLEDWHRVLDANLTSAMVCSKFAIPKMRAGGGGSIILVSSILGAIGLSGNTAGSVAYATAKAGLLGLTYSLAADYATENIRANCIIIGSVHTPMVAHMGEAARERRRQMVPTQTEGTAWDIAHGAVYLASDESRWVTGITLPIDGGLTHIRPRPL